MTRIESTAHQHGTGVKITAVIIAIALVALAAFFLLTTGKLHDGATRLSSGAGQVDDGSTELAEGAALLSTGAAELRRGATEADTGADKVADGATTAAAFSARARSGLGVSIPVSWDDLSTLKSGAQWTIATAREHLSFQTDDPWKGYWTAKQTLTGPMKVLGFTKKKKA